MKALRHIAINSFFFVIVYFGFIEGIEGAKNSALFFAWFCIVISPAIYADKIQEKIRIGELPSVPRVLDISFDLMITGILIWGDAWITGTAYFIHIIILQGGYEQAKEVAA